ncbi:hypothetical protein D3C85_1666150 [compost metagenome]
MAADVFIGSLQGIDKAECSLLGAFIQVVTEGVVDILIGQRPGNDGIGLHALAFRTRLRSASK